MSKVIVSIVSDQTVPNYLFIQEKLEEAKSKEGEAKEDYELLFISSSSDKYTSKIDLFSKVLGKKVDSVILARGDEEEWTVMRDKIESKLCEDKEYLVNLTGGTKYMALLVYSVFESKKASFYYIPYPKNKILRPGGGEDDLKYRMTVEDYFKIHGVIHGNVYNLGKEPIRDEDSTKKIFDTSILSKEENSNVRTKLQEYRDIKSDKIHLDVITKGNYYDNYTGKRFHEIENIREFLDKIKEEFKPELSNYLLKSEIDYLTGGWFEEYVYHKIVRGLDPKSIKLNINIPVSDNVNENELDVVFTLENKLFVIECKTGLIDKNKGKDKNIFKETCYKVSTVKNTTLGRLSAISYIISLSKDPNYDNNKETAEKMGINYKCLNGEDNPNSLYLFWYKFFKELKVKAFPDQNKKPIFINLSNHNSSGWSEEQILAAKSFGEIEDIKFPEIDPEADKEDIASLAEEYVRMISEIYNPKKDVVHIMGEMCFCFQAIGKLQSLGFRCLASTTKRIVQTDENGWKKSCFNFVGFRDY